MKMMKKLLLAVLTVMSFTLVSAAEKIPFTGLEKSRHISGPEVTQEMMKGKVVLFDYWGLGCPPCHASMPKLQALWKKYGDKYLIVIGSESWRRDRNQIKAFLTKNRITFPIYQGATYNNFQPGGVPHAVLIGADGKLVKMDHPGRLYGKVAQMCEALKAKK
ncbi:MAG: TlpA family protein disulfide reductase [Lentisphaeria bacterium]|nr:TlpA family protein disulfide reductase [Lentisphaeria bacterium]